MESLARGLIVMGLLLVAFGLALYAGRWVPFLGRLPGDIVIERPGFRLYLPIATCLLLSLALSAVLWLLSRLR